MATRKEAAAGAEATAGGIDLLTAVIGETNKAEASKELKALLDQALSAAPSEDDKKKSIKNAIQLIENQIKNLDKALSTQLNLILHNPDFQQLEGTWRGMKYLVGKTETGSHLKLRCLHATKKELLQDIENALDFD